jgi:ATP-dependent Zn protease
MWGKDKYEFKKDTHEIHIVDHKKIRDRISDVKGIDTVKEEVEEIIQFLRHSDKYKNAGAKLVKGFLLVGPPGTGKTMLAKALAKESETNFIYLSASEIESKYVGNSSKKIKQIFRVARNNQPCILFIDEIDSLLHAGRRKGYFII